GFHHLLCLVRHEVLLDCLQVLIGVVAAHLRPPKSQPATISRSAPFRASAYEMSNGKSSRLKAPCPTQAPRNSRATATIKLPTKSVQSGPCCLIGPSVIVVPLLVQDGEPVGLD